jgi:PKD repeat protein
MMLDRGLIRRSLMRRTLVAQHMLVPRGDVPNELPVAEFSSVPTGLSVAFTDESTDADGTIVAWDWDFGDATSHGTTQNPTHVYAAGGTYTVTLTVTDDGGDASEPVSHDQTGLRGLPTPTLLTSGSSSTDGVTMTTASVSPTANRLVLLAVDSCVDGAIPTSVVGGGITFDRVTLTATESAFRRLSWWYGKTATPSAGTIVITWGSSQTSAAWAVMQFSVDTVISGVNGVDAIVQSVGKNNQAAATSNTNTLAGLEHANNVHLCAVIHRIGPGTHMSAPGGFTELAETGADNNTITLGIFWGRGAVACTPTFGSDSHGMLSLEIKAA